MKSSYSERLKDPRWQRKRLGILNRDNWTCRACGATDKTLHVHHLAYVGPDPWDVDDLLLMTLCEDCHQEEGLTQSDAERDILFTLRRMGMDNGMLFALSAYLTAPEHLNVEQFNGLCDVIGDYTRKLHGYKS